MLGYARSPWWTETKIAVAHNLEPITLKEAAQVLRVSEAAVRRWLKQGWQRAYQIGPRALRVRRADLAGLILPLGAGLPSECTHQ